MNEKTGEVFSIAKDNQPVAGCTISKAISSGRNPIIYFSFAAGGICQDTSKKLVRSLFIPEEPQQGLCPYASLPQDIFLT